MVFIFGALLNSLSMPLLMLIGVLTLMIGNLPPTLLSILARILLLGFQSNKRLFLAALLKQNIAALLLRLLNSNGSRICSLNFVFLLLYSPFARITMALFFLHPILLCTPRPSTLSLTSILFVMLFNKSNCTFSMSLLLYRSLMFSRNL